MEVEPISQGMEQYGPWHFQDIRFHQDQHVELEAALLQTATIPGLNDTLREISRASRADCHTSSRVPEVTLSVSKPQKAMLQNVSSSISPSSVLTPATAANKTVRSLFPTTPHLVFTQIAPSDEPLLSFPLQAPSAPPRPHLKRPRPTSDVDGANTASLGCKKRRLLRHLITSRLSQPFSLPATHILNREAVTTGDKRFAKLAAMMAARKLNSPVVAPPPRQQHQPNPSTWLRRAALLNSLRVRVCAEAVERGNAQATNPTSVFQQQPAQGTAPVLMGGRYLVDSANQPTAAMPGHHNHHHHGHHGPPQPPGPGQPHMGAGAMAASGPPPNTCLRIPSPQLRPLRSPELRVTRPLVPLEDLDDLDYHDEDSMAFPTSEHESRYDDEPEEVYADFSIIFGGGDGEASDDEGGGAGRDHFEDYMDDLDGIPWGTRC